MPTVAVTTFSWNMLSSQLCHVVQLSSGKLLQQWASLAGMVCFRPFHLSVNILYTLLSSNKKHLKNVGPIHHCKPPHAHSPDVASGTVARRLRIDVHDNADNDNA